MVLLVALDLAVPAGGPAAGAVTYFDFPRRGLLSRRGLIGLVLLVALELALLAGGPAAEAVIYFDFSRRGCSAVVD